MLYCVGFLSQWKFFFSLLKFTAFNKKIRNELMFFFCNWNDSSQRSQRFQQKQQKRIFLTIIFFFDLLEYTVSNNLQSFMILNHNHLVLMIQYYILLIICSCKWVLCAYLVYHYNYSIMNWYCVSLSMQLTEKCK